MKIKKTSLVAILVSIALIIGIAIVFATSDNKNDVSGTLTSSHDNNTWIDGVSFINLAPGHETVCSEKIDIVSDDTDFIYHLTYGRQNLTLTFGLRDADGTEYCREVIGGSDNGMIEDVPAGSYALFVRNSGDYSEFPAYKDNSVSYDATGAINYSLDN